MAKKSLKKKLIKNGVHLLKKKSVVDIINKQRDIITNCLMTPEEIKDIYHSINQGVIESSKAKKRDD